MILSLSLSLYPFSCTTSLPLAGSAPTSLTPATTHTRLTARPAETHPFSSFRGKDRGRVRTGSGMYPKLVLLLGTIPSEISITTILRRCTSAKFLNQTIWSSSRSTRIMGKISRIMSFHPISLQLAMLRTLRSGPLGRGFPT